MAFRILRGEFIFKENEVKKLKVRKKLKSTLNFMFDFALGNRI